MIRLSYVDRNDGFLFQTTPAFWTVITDSLREQNVCKLSYIYSFYLFLLYFVLNIICLLFLPSFKKKKSKAYKHQNPNILNTIFDDQITSNVDKIKITYDKPVTISLRNVSIFQYVDNTNDLLRQSFSGLSKYVRVEDNTTVSIDVFPSTFNQSNATYYITADDKFVNSK